jgi:hypothetical protein
LLPQSAKFAGMNKRLAAILCLVVLGLSLGGCTKCGWLWNDWGKACHADVPK